MFENVDGRMTDAGVTGMLIAHLGAFGSGELKIYVTSTANNTSADAIPPKFENPHTAQQSVSNQIFNELISPNSYKEYSLAP